MGVTIYCDSNMPFYKLQPWYVCQIWESVSQTTTHGFPTVYKVGPISTVVTSSWFQSSCLLFAWSSIREFSSRLSLNQETGHTKRPDPGLRTSVSSLFSFTCNIFRRLSDRPGVGYLFSFFSSVDHPLSRPHIHISSSNPTHTFVSALLPVPPHIHSTTTSTSINQHAYRLEDSWEHGAPCRRHHRLQRR